MVLSMRTMVGSGLIVMHLFLAESNSFGHGVIPEPHGPTPLLCGAIFFRTGAEDPPGETKRVEMG